MRGSGWKATIACVALMAPLAAGCGGGDDGGGDSTARHAEAIELMPGLTEDLITEAEKEGELSLYRLGYAFDTKIFKEFKRLFPGIKIASYEATVPELIQRYSAEARSGRHLADVVMATQVTAVQDLDKEGLIEHFTPSNADKFPPGSIDGVLYPFSQIRLCNAYNSDLVDEDDAEALTSWDGVLDPRWKEKAGVVKFGAGGVQLLPYYYAYKEEGEDFLTGMLHDQRPLLVESVPSLTEKLAAGGLDTVFFANDGNLNTLYAQGAPVRWKCPSPAPVIYNYQFIGIDPPNPAAAKLWIEFITSEHGQKMVMDSLGLGTVLTTLEDTRPAAKEDWFQSDDSAEPFAIDWTELPTLLPSLQAAVDKASAGLKSE